MNDDKPTEITVEDIEKCLEMLINYEIKEHVCWKCSKNFFRNYDYNLCDECFFSQFPKDQVQDFYRSFFE